MSDEEEEPTIVTPPELPFRAFTELTKRLVLPFDENISYEIPPVTAENGAKFRVEQAGGRSIEGEEYYRMFLGEAYDEMIADGVDDQFVMRAAFTALADHQAGRAVAAIVWETGGDPKAVADLTAIPQFQNRASRRSSNTGAAKKTKAARTSGTRRPTA